MFAIACSLLALAISVIAVWRSGIQKSVIDQENCGKKSNKQYFISRLEKAGRNPPPPANFQKPAPTPEPPTKQYRTGNPFLRLPVPSECPRDLHYPCNDVHVEEFLREVYYK